MATARSHRPRTGVTVVLLVLATGLAALLAYQAHRAAKSQYATVEGTLEDYAAFANWEFTRHARADLLTNLITMFVDQMRWIDPADLDRTLPTADLFAYAARKSSDKWCKCLGGVRAFFRYTWRDGTLTTTGAPLPAGLRRWIGDTVVAYASSVEKSAVLTPTPFGSVDEQVPRGRRSVVYTNDSYGLVLDARSPDGVLLAFVVSRDTAGGDPIAAFGFATDPAAFLAPVFSEILKRPLLPPSLVGTRQADSLLSVAALDVSGRVLYRSPARFAGPFAAVDTLDRRFGNIVVSTALRPEIAPSLVVGGLPRSRLPMLVGLFVLTVGLMIVAFVQLRRQQQLFRMRSEFVSGVSHELRTPLAHIRLFAELLQSGKLRTEEERIRSARVIDQEARRLSFLIDNVLTFGRAERGATRLTLMPIDIAREVEDVVGEFDPLAGASGMRLEADVSEHAVVLADRVALRQVIINLLDNAVKYGPRGQCVSIGFAREHGEARVWVQDEGPGIPPEERVRAFEPYYRLPRDASSPVGGSGIGLAVVRELVAMQGGRVWADSAPGGGARISFTLPLADAFDTADTAEWPMVEQAHT